MQPPPMVEVGYVNTRSLPQGVLFSGYEHFAQFVALAAANQYFQFFGSRTFDLHSFS